MNDLEAPQRQHLVNVATGQGLCVSQPESCTSRDWLGRLWRHECERVYSDRLISDVEVKAFSDIMLDALKKNVGIEVGHFPVLDLTGVRKGYRQRGARISSTAAVSQGFTQLLGHYALEKSSDLCLTRRSYQPKNRKVETFPEWDARCQ